MSFPSLPIVHQWLKLAFGVKLALGILLPFGNNGSSGALIWNVAPYVLIRGQVTSPFSALPAQRISPANETMSYELRVCVCVCVCDYRYYNAIVLVISAMVKKE